MDRFRWFFGAFFLVALWIGGSSLEARSKIVNVIKEIPPTGIQISSPGTYIFSGDIFWSPVSDGQAIWITSDNVVLDLKGHTLESALTSYNTVGILAASVSNLTIKNGTVLNLGLIGIKCEGCEQVRVKKITVDGLNLDNVATYTVPVGILVSSSVNAHIEKCLVKNINVRTGSTAAIQLTSTINSKVIHCRVKDLLNKDGACTGIGHLFCDQAEVKSCTVDNLKSEFIDNLNTEGHTAIGIVPVTSTNLQIKDCEISNITGCCDDAHGISIFECLNAVVEKCRVKNVLDGNGPLQTGAKATGIEVYASGVRVFKCRVKNIKAINPQDKQATGFSAAQCLGVNFIKCLAENVSVVNENGEDFEIAGK